MTDVYQKGCDVPTLDRVIDSLEAAKKGAPVEYVHGLRAALHLSRAIRAMAIEADNINDVLNAITGGDIDSLLPEAPASVVAGMKLPEAAKAMGIDLDGVLADIERDAMEERNRRPRVDPGASYGPITFPKHTLQHGTSAPTIGSNINVTDAGGVLTISAPGVPEAPEGKATYLGQLGGLNPNVDVYLRDGAGNGPVLTGISVPDNNDGAGQAPEPELEDARDPETVVDGIEFASPQAAANYRFGERAADIINKIAPYPYRSHTR
ncbi:hypothetical protein H1O16_gp102 [Burkholderia phage BcepSaruman]|uniref:Uncharacterized protein n=1 Tax=Burkholderia phage BcepSaruman TaxID=2530032 RepID=A0A4D5ZBY4_9CAUD|nr:hypothetical protein H1O16_gp102 [Burkholderia phage BcepSaruman]QBX06515.1 hypothetical protein BcepSaruman_102 [Burkholderia phage BcepSaruman]